MKAVEKVVLWTVVGCGPLFGLMARDMVLYLEQRNRYAPPDNRSTINAVDLPLSVGFALIIGTVRNAFFRILGPVIERNTRIKPHYDAALIAARKDRAVSNCFGVLFYVAATVLGWWVLVDKDWSPSHIVFGANGSSDNCWTNFWTYRAPFDVRVYYAFGLGHSFHSLYMQLFRKERRRDFFEMMVHHIVTVLLISLSYIYGYTRIGTLVLLVHDFSDVFICLARAANEITHPKVTFSFFLLLFVSWIYLRLYCYPFTLVWSATFDSVPIANAQGFEGQNAGYWPFNVLLWILVILHTFWFFMFVRMMQAALIHHKVDDNVNLVEKKKVVVSGPSGKSGTPQGKKTLLREQSHTPAAIPAESF